MDLSSLTPLEGGLSGETFLGEVAGERCVVRIYAAPGDRGDAAADIDAALVEQVTQRDVAALTAEVRALRAEIAEVRRRMDGDTPGA